MAIREIPVDPEWQATFKTVADVRAVMVRGEDGPTGEQVLDRETGLPMWEVSVNIKQHPDAKIELISVKVPAAKSPVDLEGKRVVFGGLRGGFYAMSGFRDTLNSGWTFKADTVADAAAPSTRRPPVPQEVPA